MKNKQYILELLKNSIHNLEDYFDFDEGEFDAFFAKVIEEIQKNF